MLKKLKKSLKSEKKNKAIFDIVIYGSSVKGKLSSNDTDIMVIFREGTLRERLDGIQSIKQRLKQFEKVDIKQMTLYDLFSSEFMARTGILVEGVSIFEEKHFCLRLGFNPFALFWYQLTGLTHTEKVKFNYILAGRNKKGILDEFKGERLSGGAVKIPIEHSNEFESILKNNKVNYTRKDILEVN
jgi:predicted nucleotidyltransferase